MKDKLKQGKVYLRVNTPLGANQVVLTEFTAREYVSELFEIDLVMATDKSNVNLEHLIGQAITVEVELTNSQGIGASDTPPSSPPSSRSSKSLFSLVKRGLDKLKGGVATQISRPMSVAERLKDRIPGGISFSFSSPLKRSSPGVSNSLGSGLSQGLKGGISGVEGDNIISLATYHHKPLNAGVEKTYEFFSLTRLGFGLSSQLLHKAKTGDFHFIHKEEGLRKKHPVIINQNETSFDKKDILGKFFKRRENPPAIKAQDNRRRSVVSEGLSLFSKSLKFGSSEFSQKGAIRRNLSRNIRYFNGIVGEISQGPTDLIEGSNLTFYKAKLHPKLWLLKYSSNCRIFQNISVVDIIKKVLHENEIRDFQDKTTKCGHSKREYCVQYNESNFDFISRLMEEEGIFYYFIHTENKHTLVLADSPQAHHQCPHTQYANMEKKQGGDLHFFNLVQYCDLAQRVVLHEQALKDYNFERPSQSLAVKVKGKGKGGRVYQYPGKYTETSQGNTIATHRIEGREVPRDMIYGQSTIPFFEPSSYFNLQGHPKKEANKKYVLLQIDHHAKQVFDDETSTLYTNNFSAFNFSSVPYRPPIKTPKPKIYGTQTARVTGKKGEEIWTDKYGRVKVKFHWDESSIDNEKSSCWIRVAHGWAGNSWGMLFTPRIGHEVVVSFLEGDPDRPLITGSVYNGEKQAPYLPDHPTVSTIRSKSSKKSHGYNEIRFEDLTDKEQFYMHAQRNMDIEIEKDRTEIVGYNDTKVIKSGYRHVTLTGQPYKKKKMMAGSMGTPPGVTPSAGTSEGKKSTLKQGLEKELEKGIEKGIEKGLEQKFGKTLGKGNIQKAVHTAEGFLEHKENINADDVLILERGNRHVTLNAKAGSANHTTLLKDGDHKTTIEKGNLVTSLNMGNRTTTLMKGNDTLKVIGNVTHDVLQNYTLKIGGNLAIEVVGEIVINGQTLNCTTDAETSFNAGAELTMEAGADLNASAGGAISLEAGADISTESGGATTITAGAAVTIEAASVEITAALISLA